MRTAPDIRACRLFRGNNWELTDCIKENRSCLRVQRRRGVGAIRCQDSHSRGFSELKPKNYEQPFSRTQAVLSPVSDPASVAKKVQ